MKTKRDFLTATVLAILLVALASPMASRPASASEDEHGDDLKIVAGEWYRLETDIVTVLFPAGGKKPMFIWWYTKAPDQIYVVKYQGLIEYFTFSNQSLSNAGLEYYNRLREAWRERFEEMYMEPEEHRLMGIGELMKLRTLQQILMQISETWHMPFLPFSAGTWNLSKPEFVTKDGKAVGVAFAFKLEHVPFSGFQFAENNIMVRVRFYNATVTETVPGTNVSYEVTPGEMKMDLVINKWIWNIDAIKDLIARLQTAGIDVKVPKGQTHLALWVNLASINMTKLAMVEEEPEEIEYVSTASHMEVEGEPMMSVVENRTAPPFEEQEKPIIAERPWWAVWQHPKKPLIKVRFANETTTLAGFFKFVSSAKVTTPENVTSTVPVKGAYIAAGHHLRLFLGYPYFGNSTLEHDPSIGVDVAGIDTTPQYTVEAPSGINSIYPTVIGPYVLPLFTTEMVVVLAGAVSIVAIMIYVAKWTRKTPINMVGAS